MTYTYLQDAEAYCDVLRYSYQKKTLTLPLTVRVTPDLQVEVLDVRSESLNVGTEGYVYMTLKNVGHETVEKAIAMVTRSGSSPLIPTDGNEQLGTF